MTASAVTTARRERGFSLLEVMVAVAILSIALSGLTMTLSRAVRAANHARLMTTATFLCRQKLVETEDKFIVDGFTDEAGIKEESGDFKEQIYQNANLGKYTWSRTIERVRLPAAADMQQAATKMLQDRQQIGGGSSAPTPPGGAGGSSATSLSGGLGNMLGPVKEMLEQGIRRVTVRVMWFEPGAGDQRVEVVSFYTDMRRIPVTQ